MNDNSITSFAETTFRQQHQRFGIKRSDRGYHMALIGRTGMGKSTLMENLMLSDARNGEGFALIDPHGDVAERVFHELPEDRRGDVVYFVRPCLSIAWGSISWRTTAAIPTWSSPASLASSKRFG